MDSFFSDSGWAQAYASVAGALFTGVGLFLTAWAIRLQVNLSRMQKQIDVVIECNRRYDVASEKVKKLLSQRVSRKKPLTYELHSAYRSYWLVYYEEWQFFIIGMVPVENYYQWTLGLTRNFSIGSEEGFLELNLIENWKEFGAISWGYTGPFVDFIQEIINISSMPAKSWNKNIRSAIFKTRKRRKKHF